MKPRDAFGVVVRVFGLSLLIYSLWYLVYGVAIFLGLTEEGRIGVVPYFLSGILFLLLSAYFLRGAPHIMRFSYPEQG